MKYFFVIISLLFASIAQAKDVEMKYYEFDVLRIIDGDTVVFKADFLPEPLKPQLSIRVYGVDTPEKSWRAECESEAAQGEKASKFTTRLISQSKKIKVGIYKWDKFGGRVLGDIIIDGESLRELLINKGFAREYYGDKKESWCK